MTEMLKKQFSRKTFVKSGGAPAPAADTPKPPAPAEPSKPEP